MSLFSAKNRVPLTAPTGVGSNTTIQVDSSLRRWFNRNLGLWRSRRQYTFSNDQVLHLDMNLKMEAFAQPEAGESRYRFSWWPDGPISADFFERKPIRLVDQDQYRYRAVYSWENGVLAIVEHHHEIRLSDAFPAIEEP